MAQIDPSIALGFKQPQIQDPLVATARAQDIGVNALKMGELQRGIAQENKLREVLASGADLDSPETIRQLYSISPKVGAEFEKNRAVLRKEKFGAQKMESEAIDSRLKVSRDLLDGIQTPEQYILWHEANHRDPVLGPLLAARGITADQSRQRIMSALSQPGGLQKLINESKLGVQKFTELNTISAAQQQTADIAREGQKLTYTAATQPVFSEASGGFYTRPTGGNAAEFIPASGTDMTTKGKSVNIAKQNVTTLASEMAQGYKNLLDKKAIKSTEAGAASNLSASSQSSMVGQILGGVFGTEEQDIRDYIKSQRPLLVQAIVKATGMSAQQINSNAELKNMLDAATDPGRGYESNIRALNGLNTMFGTGTPILPSAPVTPAIAPAAKPTLESIFAPAKK